MIPVLPLGDAETDEEELVLVDDDVNNVDYMMELIEEGYEFTKKSWVEGVHAQDIKIKDKCKVVVGDDIADFIASRVESRVSE